MFTLQDILQGNARQITPYSKQTLDLSLTFQAAQHDSRHVEAGDLFVALPGTRVDGNKFLSVAANAGARGALCTEPDPTLPDSFLQLVVPDTLHALQMTARARVQRQPQTRKIGITGSSGKTTIKEAIAAILSRQAPTLKTHASYNNELGYPLTLLRMEDDHRYAVLEMGAERVGELTWLCETIAKPDWSLINTVGAAHLAHFGSLERVAQAKSELVRVLSADDLAVLNADDERVAAMASHTKARVLTYGTGEGAQVRATDISNEQLGGSHFTLRYQDQAIPLRMHLPGMHGVTTALAAAAVGCAANISLEEIQAALETLKPVKGRGGILPGPNGSRMIDDTYNAIRQSVIAILRTMQATPVEAGGKRWAVLGELLEQGTHSQHEHYETGKAVAGCVDYLIALGDDARFFVKGALHAGMPIDHIYHYPVVTSDQNEVEAAKQTIAEMLQARVAEKDLLLVKGSRGMRMETLFSMVH